MTLLPGIANSVLEFEDNPIRFERVCIDLYHAAEGIELVPTSRNYDLGRDARSIGASSSSGPPGVLCATLSSNLDKKVEHDLNRLLATTITNLIIYCSSQELTEHASDAIAAQIRNLYPPAETVHVLGRVQLIALADRYPETLRRHYIAEIHNVEQALLQSSATSADPEHLGLRLALLSQTGDDARVLRSELTKRLVLEALEDATPKTPNQLSRCIASWLHLSRAPSDGYIRGILAQLVEEAVITFDGERASITREGRTSISTIPQNASSRLLEGRAAIRNAIRQLSGHALVDHHYGRVWDTLQDGLADLFYSQGMAIMKMVGALVSGHRNALEARELLLIERLADRILPLFSDPVQGTEVRQAIIDMFSEKDTEAFRWLSQICSVYVMMCSLGFESLSSREITSALRAFRLTIDTDVLISLLCPGEANHIEVERVILGWKAIGGKFQAAPPVLEEVAYHAWISETDFRSLENQLPQIHDTESNHLISNAFVRSFWKATKGQTRRALWSSYIRDYRGDSQWDYGRVWHFIREEYGFDMLPETAEQHQDFANQISEFLENRVCQALNCSPEELDFRAKDKCRRDGLLFASVLDARNVLRRAGVGGSAMILSSARLLKEADNYFRSELGEPDAVISPAALGCLLTLVPGVGMGLGTIRGVLFDVGIGQRFSTLERYAYRLLSSSEEFTLLPWSRRTTLRRKLTDRILSDARKRGEPVRDIVDRVVRSEDPDYSAKIVADALDQMAVAPVKAQRIEELESELDRVKRELAEARQKGARADRPKRRPRPRSRK